MARPPSAALARDRAERIYARHLNAEDTHLEYMPDSRDLAGVVQYILIHDQLPGDIADCLEIVWHLRGELDRRELALLHAAERHNVPRSALAVPMGLASRRGVEMRLLRLEAAAHGRVRREKDERANERGTRWLQRNRDRILRAARAVLAAMDGRVWWSDEAAEDADGLADILSPDASGGEVMGWLRPLAKDWEHSPAAPDLPALRDALALADEWDASR